MDIGNLLSDEGVVAEVPFGDAFVTIRYVSREKLLEIGRKSGGRGINPKDSKGQGVNHVEATRLLGEAAIIGWRGITQGGEELPFSPDTRDRLMAVWGEFVTFVNDACTDLERLVTEGRAEAKKN